MLYVCIVKSKKPQNKMKKIEKSFRIPRIEFFDNDRWKAWKILQKILESRGNPPWSISGDLDLRNTPIQSLGDLTSVGGNLDLRYTEIKSLGNLTSVGGSLNLERTQIKSLGNLTSVRGSVYLNETPIKCLGNLIIVGDILDLGGTPLAHTCKKEKIRQMVNVGVKIWSTRY